MLLKWGDYASIMNHLNRPMGNMILGVRELSERSGREFMGRTQNGGARMGSPFSYSMRRDVCRERKNWFIRGR
jgi:hypothetical protein